MNEEPPKSVHLDGRAVRVLAHPLRSRILSELRKHGPATATELASALSTNTGATSYHLRALEGVGLVMDTGDGVGKRRIWRASSDSHSWTNSGFSDDEDAQTAVDWLRRDYVRYLSMNAERWLDAEPEWPAEWVDLLGLNDTLLTVTPAQLADLRGDITAVLERYRSAGIDDPDARRISLAISTTPVDFDAPRSRES